jgi:predicted peptidase
VANGFNFASLSPAHKMLEKIPLETVTLGKKDPAWMSDFKAGDFKYGSKNMLFRLYEPVIEEGQTYPIVLWLHGVKGRGDDNHRQISAGNSHAPAFFGGSELQAQFPAYVLVPQCPGGKFWINFTNKRIRRPLKLAMTMLSHLMATLPIDPERVYVGGQSMGAFATWAILAEHNDLFAAGIPVAGGGSTRKAKKAIKAPVWIFHGAADPIVNVARSREMAEVLAAAGKPHLYTEIATGRHDIWPQVFTEPDLAAWLFAARMEAPRRRRK